MDVNSIIWENLIKVTWIKFINIYRKVFNKPVIILKGKLFWTLTNNLKWNTEWNTNQTL